ncbi:unnamed protein product [Meloidogyne enterolobii]|uniref:Uncharacterized protein n=1 Tax=Meloidogyne enterolobii TaxID=390850 RepID=A0ACB1A6U2_MELEN
MSSNLIFRQLFESVSCTFTGNHAESGRHLKKQLKNCYFFLKIISYR